MVNEVSFWMKNLRKLNGWRMWGSEEIVYCKAGVVDMFSDASDFQLAGAKFEEEQVCWDTRFKVSLTEGEKSSSSTFRELRAIEEGLRAHGRTLRGKIVRWGCDNWSAGKIVKWGSMKRDCHSVALEIEKLCREFEIKLETFWISRDSKQIEFCDAWSKEVDESDYCMSKVCFRDLWDKFGPFSADYFASDRTYRMKPFFARFALGESEGVDAFAVLWREGFGFFHPPVGLISRVVRKAERERAKGVLIAPEWPGSSRLLVVEEMVRLRKLLRVDNVSLVLECPREIVSDTFRGVPKFNFDVLMFNY